MGPTHLTGYTDINVLNCVLTLDFFYFFLPVEVRRGSDGVIIKMRDRTNVRCVYNNPQAGSLPDYAPHPAIVLKMEDGSDLLLPIIVC